MSDRFAEICRNCKEVRGKHAAVSPLNDEHWCPKSSGGFREDHDNIGPNTFHGSGQYDEKYDPGIDYGPVEEAAAILRQPNAQRTERIAKVMRLLMNHAPPIVQADELYMMAVSVVDGL